MQMYIIHDAAYFQPYAKIEKKEYDLDSDLSLHEVHIVHIKYDLSEQNILAFSS